MTMYDLIYKKREGKPLSREEISYFVQGYTKGTIPDYQASALLMTIYFRKMTKEETFDLTDAMWHSGDTMDLSSIEGIKVDKHSTGGVGDKTTLIVAPLVAACGVPVAKMSGRGLGFTGGTVDKLESIPGFRTTMEPQEFLQQVRDIGIGMIGQTAHVAPADKKLYALRDVTATVDNLSLIASSIMSKKLAAGSDAIVLDVKCGEGAFMEQVADAEELGRAMVDIGTAAGKKTIALMTDMSQPLGFAVGNGVEVMEAIRTLNGNGPMDLELLSLTLASYMLVAGGKAETVKEGFGLAKKALDDGSALEKWKQLIQRQGGDIHVLEDFSLFAQPRVTLEVLAQESGYVSRIHARTIGLASQRTGAGRQRKEDSIDFSAGIRLKKKVGDFVKAGETLASVFGNDEALVSEGAELTGQAYSVSQEVIHAPTLLKGVIGGW